MENITNVLDRIKHKEDTINNNIDKFIDRVLFILIISGVAGSILTLILFLFKLR